MRRGIAGGWCCAIGVLQGIDVTKGHRRRVVLRRGFRSYFKIKKYTKQIRIN